LRHQGRFSSRLGAVTVRLGVSVIRNGAASVRARPNGRLWWTRNSQQLSSTSAPPLVSTAPCSVTTASRST
jgi:hypothetical protein